MIGDIFLYLSTKLKQSFCIHDYHFKGMNVGLQHFTTGKCQKCGRIITRK